MGLFPPVFGSRFRTNSGKIIGNSPGHRFILQKYYHIRFETLFKRMFVVGIATACAVVVLKDKDDDSEAT